MGYGGQWAGAEKTRVALQMRHLLLHVWRVRRPNIVITVTGGAKAFKCSKLLKQRFKHGLIRAAQNTGALRCRAAADWSDFICVHVLSFTCSSAFTSHW